MEVLTVKEMKKAPPGEGYCFSGVIGKLAGDRYEGKNGTGSQRMEIEDGQFSKNISVAWHPPETDDLKLHYVGTNCYFMDAKIEVMTNDKVEGKPKYNGIQADSIMTEEEFLNEHGQPEPYSGGTPQQATPGASASPAPTITLGKPPANAEDIVELGKYYTAATKGWYEDQKAAQGMASTLLIQHCMMRLPMIDDIPF